MVDLPVGFHPFSRRRFYNYQLNRWYSLGYTRPEEIERAGRSIASFDDNKRVFTGLARTAARQGRLRNAAFYYRAAEFLTDPEDPDKLILYQRFRDAFYAGFADEGIDRQDVAYGSGFLSVMRLAAAVPESRGTVVIHGGFDSFIEEFFCFWKFFSERGYDVVAFDGPGQGATHRLHSVPHDHDWERPVGAILDHFGLTDVTLLGISFGGYWCLRAAAFEKRVSRVISDPPLYDLLAGRNRALLAFVARMLRSPRFFNASIRLRMRMFPVIRHVVRNCLYITNQLDAEPVAAVRWLLDMNAGHQHSELVDQDVLLLAGEKDRFQPERLFRMQRAALLNARSLTGRVFTRAEQAQNHVQIGNLPLSLAAMGDWLDQQRPSTESTEASDEGDPDHHRQPW
jgi:pimeloyl-ACP methyl ester carboxylesterase